MYNDATARNRRPCFVGMRRALGNKMYKSGTRHYATEANLGLNARGYALGTRKKVRELTVDARMQGR
jgi:hypothetical protein